MRVILSGAIDGWFVRRPSGRIVFIWGDGASPSCEVVGVSQPSSNVLSVVFDPCDYVFGNEVRQAQAISLWRPRRVGAEDSTGVIDLARPRC